MFMTSPYPREPNIHSGGAQEPGGPVPPYEGRQRTGATQEELARDPQKQGEGLVAGPREVSQVEREGVSATDATAATPLGVGRSINTRGNERLVGKSEAAHDRDRLDHGVGGRSANVDPSSPIMQPGDGG